MNKQLEKFARDTLKEGLAKCTDGEHLMFKRMYSHKNLKVDINTAVDNMDIDKLNRAMEQVQATLDKK